MRQISKKKAERNRKKQEAYRIVDEDFDGICKGCGLSKPISHSHIIPVSEALELEAEPDNITHHCLECHKKHESHNIEVMKTMLDFEENMEYIRVTRPLYYNRLLSK